MIIALNILLIIISLIILIYILERDLGLFLLSFIILLQYIWMFFSILVIENGIYINEQGRYGYPVFSGLILLLFYITSLIALIFYKKFFNSLFKKTPAYKFKIKPLKDSKLASIIIGIILFIAYFNLLSSPIPLLSEEVTKFNFWEYSKYPFLRSIIGNVIAFAGFGAALLYRYNKKISLIYLTFYISYLVLLDQKFTGFLIAIYGILTALYFSSKENIKFKLKWIFNKYLISIFIILFCLVYYKYSIEKPFEYLGLNTLESVFYRAFGLQAHVFWGTVEHHIFIGEANSWDFLEIWKGMHVLMKDFWPWSYESYISVTSRGVSWTNAYPSILIRIFPLPIALLVNMILLSIVGCFQTLLKHFIEKKAYVLSIVFFQLLMWVSYAYTMAYFNKLIIPIILLFALSFFTFLNKKIKKHG
ncbi:DUF6418 domain-containing protein [uncultured Tenacibaculum sp.]|uniref:DUF6418 domain-containing protein n=1 Tax=uncultured Tenacibaculum sp. TaxID=174713 RepID=UPI002619473B|nr:DUF6418 domain-containing protein [uncultured Tenacibaculum sp.]